MELVSLNYFPKDADPSTEAATPIHEASKLALTDVSEAMLFVLLLTYIYI